MLRRHFLASSLILPFAMNARASEDLVQLLVLRDGAEPLACGTTRYLKGTLYGVPASQSLEATSSSIGLTPIAYVEELPYELDAENASAIKAGIYSAIIKTDKTKDWMTNENRWWRLELLGTQLRTGIQFHYGKDFRWSKGCIILTGTESLVCREGRDSPEEAVATLRNYVLTGHNSRTKIRVKIAFAD